ncbi:MAG: hypothetical protein ACYTDX_08430 [Planctomycetota bacterium]|jgi:hypothetical protein
MTDERPGKDVPPCGDGAVHCRRTGQEYEVDKHVRCPYCFGEEGDVATGNHEKFCDFEPGKDPVSFGFPKDSERLTRG